MKDQAFSLLGDKNLSRTPCRVGVIRTLLESGSALSETEIRNKLAYNFDRTTIYRTIRSFLEQGVIHSIALEGGEIRYAITHNREEISPNFHAHFFCDGCNNVYCLPKPGFSPPVLPEGFVAGGYDLVINGQCSKCSSSIRFQ
jgi:Fur family transcriptional regulator, ferric uptake regulator